MLLTGRQGLGYGRLLAAVRTGFDPKGRQWWSLIALYWCFSVTGEGPVISLHAQASGVCVWPEVSIIKMMKREG